jgi:hypothetical protein
LIGLRRSRIGAVTTIAALATIGAAAGCTSSGQHDSPRSSTQSASGAALPSGVVGVTSLPASVPNKTALRSNVTMSSCAAAHGGWRAGGTARNPAKHAATYTITVYFTTDHATVIGTAATKVSLAPGESRPWTATGTFHPATPTLCILRGVG